MKVLILQDYLRGGGTERQSIELTRALHLQGIQSQLVVGRSGGPLDQLAKATLGDRVFHCSATHIT